MCQRSLDLLVSTIAEPCQLWKWLQDYDSRRADNANDKRGVRPSGGRCGVIGPHVSWRIRRGLFLTTQLQNWKSFSLPLWSIFWASEQYSRPFLTSRSRRFFGQSFHRREIISHYCGFDPLHLGHSLFILARLVKIIDKLKRVYRGFRYRRFSGQSWLLCG